MPNDTHGYDEPFLDTDPSPPSPTSSTSSSVSSSAPYVLYRGRFLILFTFSLLSFNQSLFWLTFSPISNEAMAYYNVDVNTVNLLLNWGPIIYIPCQFLTFWLASVRGGLRKVVLCSSSLCSLAMLLRVVPNLLWHPSSAAFQANAIWFLHAAHILNAAAGPLVMSTVSQCSALWFGVNERAKVNPHLPLSHTAAQHSSACQRQPLTSASPRCALPQATSIAIFSNNLGAAIGFLQIPAQVPSGQGQDIPNLLYTHLGMAVFASLLTLAYFPASPPSPPSHAAELMMRPIPQPHSSDEAVVISHPHGSTAVTITRQSTALTRAITGVLREFWACCRNTSFLLLAVAGGGVLGVFNGWSALFNNILGPLLCDGAATCDDASTIAGWFGFSSTVAAVVGGFIMGAIADTRRFSRHMKLLTLTSAAIAFACFCWFIFSVPTPFAATPILASNTASLGVAITACGFALGLINPLYYELGAEITYPTPEQYSAGVITLFNNALGIVFIFAQPYFSSGLMNCAMFVTVVVTGLMVLPVKERYLRRDDDERKAAGQAVNVQDEVDVEKEDEYEEEDEPSGNGIARKSQYRQQRFSNGHVEEM